MQHRGQMALLGDRLRVERELTPPLCERGSNRRRGGLMSLLEKLKNLAAKSAEKGDTAIDKAGDFFDKTQAKTDNAIDKVQEAAKKAVDKGSPNT